MSPCIRCLSDAAEVRAEGGVKGRRLYMWMSSTIGIGTGVGVDVHMHRVE
jgi:hypothetical protein